MITNCGLGGYPLTYIYTPAITRLEVPSSTISSPLLSSIEWRHCYEAQLTLTEGRIEK